MFALSGGVVLKLVHINVNTDNKYYSCATLFEVHSTLHCSGLISQLNEKERISKKGKKILAT
jgi:hypothetical protein